MLVNRPDGDYLDRMFTRHTWLRWATACILAAAAVPSTAAELPEGFDPARHLSLDEVRPGMTGYGLSVFRGTQPEPFDVEVISVEPAYRPGKAVIWIRCTDPRMQKLGPVSGMSGSPIYLWSDDDRPRRRDGSTGRLIGAFAYGFGLSKDAYAGVQPIEQMLAVHARAAEPGAAKAEPASAQGRLLDAALAALDRMDLPATKRWRMDVAARLGRAERAGDASGDPPSTADHHQPTALAIPLTVADRTHAHILAPFFKSTGLRLVAGATMPGGKPPAWINPQRAKLEPGAVISVPMVTGDIDLPAVGTITEVLRDGDGRITGVLALGHAFMGEGSVRLPMATGYVHYVQPSIQTSFKMGGTLKVRGALVNDESSAVVGRADVEAPFRPSTVTVTWPDPSKSRTMRYRIADHYYYLPMLTAYTAVLSISLDTAIPLHATMVLHSRLRFSGGREVTVDAVAPDATGMEAFAEMMPFLALLTDNEFQPLKLESARTRIEIKPEHLGATMTNITLKRSVVRPGEPVIVDVAITPFRGEPFIHRCRLTVPDDLPDGTYPLFVGGARSYVQRRMETHPHLSRVSNVDELLAALVELTSAPDDALYATLVLQPRRGLAIGRTELPDLPTSRQAMLGVPTSTQTTPYVETIEHRDPMKYVVTGSLSVPVTVKRYPESE